MWFRDRVFLNGMSKFKEGYAWPIFRTKVHIIIFLSFVFPILFYYF